MNKETKTYFDFERKKHFEFFLPFYQNKNWQVAEDNINGNISMPWDVNLEIFVGQYVLVDEKALTTDYGHCLVELMQDIKTGNLGWFFGKKDWILYGNWYDIESKEPSSLHLIKMYELKKYIYSFKGILRTAISHKGWGITWNITLYWSELIERGIVEKLL